jgi:hypothetical protein
MNTRLGIGGILVGALLLCGLGACTTSEAQGGSGGSIGPGNGGVVPQGGNGGSTAVAGTTGTSGTDGVMCPLPGKALITDFTYPPPGVATPDPTQVHFGDSTVLAGGQYAYPAADSSYPIKSDVTQSNWHLTGTVGDYSGFGLYFDNCTRADARAYKGISFTISGTVQGNQITMVVGTLNNTITAEWLIAHPSSGVTPKVGDPGRCVPPATAVNKYSQTTCHDAEKIIPVSATPTPVSVLWGDFTKGAPVSSVEPGDIVTISWYLPWTGSGPQYPVDITLDDLTFIP